MEPTVVAKVEIDTVFDGNVGQIQAGRRAWPGTPARRKRAIAVIALGHADSQPTGSEPALGASTGGRVMLRRLFLGALTVAVAVSG